GQDRDRGRVIVAAPLEAEVAHEEGRQALHVGDLQVDVVEAQIEGNGIRGLGHHGTLHGAGTRPPVTVGLTPLWRDKGSGMEWPGLTTNRPAVFRSRPP